MQDSKNIKLLNMFAHYCIGHPEERFWQALRNWAGYNFILLSKDLAGLTAFDSFNLGDDYANWPKR